MCVPPFRSSSSEGGGGGEVWTGRQQTAAKRGRFENFWARRDWAHAEGGKERETRRRAGVKGGAKNFKRCDGQSVEGDVELKGTGIDQMQR